MRHLSQPESSLSGSIRSPIRLSLHNGRPGFQLRWLAATHLIRSIRRELSLADLPRITTESVPALDP